ncbi:MAG: cytidine deaminase [Elusimicrobia bacterium]|nr:cytidine deaminase [Elusimicrobiota bacterium]
MEKEIQELVQMAKVAAEKAYAPYSKFKIGAALLTSSGKMYSGCNVENASYGLSICAEQVAIVKAVSSGEIKFKIMVIFTDTADLTPPCGACRQVVAEFNPRIEMILVNKKGEMKALNMDKLLVEPFGLNRGRSLKY